jgi:hypothetical protein
MSLNDYCDSNTKMFNNFTSMKKTIVPAVADDWQLIPEAYNNNAGAILYSKKLNQKVADVNLRKLLRFMSEYEISSKGLHFEGSFIIGKDRTLYTEDMYNEWLKKYSQRLSTKIECSKAIPGHKYKTACGSLVVYLGYKYVVTFNLKKFNTSGVISPSKTARKTYFVAPVYHTFVNQKESYKEKYGDATPLKDDLVEDLGEVLDESSINEKLSNYYNKHNTVLYWDDKDIKKPFKVKFRKFKDLRGISNVDDIPYRCVIFKTVLKDEKGENIFAAESLASTAFNYHTRLTTIDNITRNRSSIVKRHKDEEYTIYFKIAVNSKYDMEHQTREEFQDNLVWKNVGVTEAWEPYIVH